jgi:hypothetical protein
MDGVFDGLLLIEVLGEELGVLLGLGLLEIDELIDELGELLTLLDTDVDGELHGPPSVYVTSAYAWVIRAVSPESSRAIHPNSFRALADTLFISSTVHAVDVLGFKAYSHELETYDPVSSTQSA